MAQTYFPGGSASVRLPVKGTLTTLYGVSLFIALGMSGASAAGLLYSAILYPSDELVQSFVANDVVNLAVGLPVVLGSLWLARRGRLVGLLFWPGALMYVFYTYVPYVLGASPSWAYLLYLALVTSSGYALIALLSSIDGHAVRQRLAGRARPRLSGGVLVVFGAFFLVRVVGLMAGALIKGETVPSSELPVLVSDFLVSPAWVIGGVMLWQRKAFGYVTGAGLLFQASMLFVGLIVFLLVRPLLTEVPFDGGELAIVAVMGAVCSIPFALYTRGLLSDRAPVE